METQERVGFQVHLHQKWFWKTWTCSIVNGEMLLILMETSDSAKAVDNLKVHIWRPSVKYPSWCSGMYFQMLIYYYCFVQSRHTYVMCVYISILLVLIFGVRRVYVNHGTVIFVQFNVQQASIHGVRARIELTELNFCVLPNSHRREIQLHQTWGVVALDQALWKV